MDSSVPHPGYSTSKPLIAPIRSMYKELGAQDACIQLQELSANYLEKSAAAMNAQVNDFLKLLYKANGIPHGSYNFAEMRSIACTSYLLVTHSLFDKMVKGCIRHYRTANPATDTQWVNSVGGKTLAPLRRLAHNLPKPEQVKLTSPAEFRLFEYYRQVRVAGTHVADKTQKKAAVAFAALTQNDIQHFAEYAQICTAPNKPEAIGFDDFKLYTRSIKYYSNILNDVCS